MKEQSYSNHIRFYAPHHFIFYPMMSVLYVSCIYFVFTRPEKLLWIFISLLFLSVIWLSYMLRQHYALTLQNRIVKMELRYRYFAITGERFENVETRLQDSQLFALRFCSDAELPEMVQLALQQNLSGDKIKLAIKHWKADNGRV